MSDSSGLTAKEQVSDSSGLTTNKHVSDSSGLTSNEQVSEKQWSYGQRASVGQAVVLWPTKKRRTGSGLVVNEQVSDKQRWYPEWPVNKCRTDSGLVANEQVSDRQWRYPEWPMSKCGGGTNCQEEIVVVSNESRIQSLSLEPTRRTNTAPPTCSARTQNCNNGPRLPLTWLLRNKR